MNSFGAQVRLARETLGITQLELERRCGMSQSWVSQIENGHRLPSLPKAISLSRALRISLDALCRGEP